MNAPDGSDDPEAPAGVAALDPGMMREDGCRMRSRTIVGGVRPLTRWMGAVEQARDARVWSAVRAAAAQEHATISIRHVVLAGVRLLSATGAGLSMSRDSGPGQPVLATGPLIEELEELQFTLGQAPCSESVVAGGPVLVPDLAEPSAGRRWPAFAPAVIERGVHGMFTFPVALGAALVGVLSVYRTDPGPLTRTQIDDGLALADILLGLALDSRGGIAPEMDALLDTAIASRRAEVHQAAGAVAAQLDVSVAEALVRLRAHAYVNGRRISDVAGDIMNGRLRLIANGDGPQSPDGKEGR